MADRLQLAEERKRAGNEAFGKKDYDAAIKCYTEAIDLDPQNHIYYSNRSICFAEKGKLESAKDDAEQCVRLDPTFVKGYHRLANALFLLGNLDEAARVVRSGLERDSNMPELQKLLRRIKAKKSATTKKGMQRVATVEEGLKKEIDELRESYHQTGRDFNEVRAKLEASMREQRRIALTTSEVDKVSSDLPMYRSVGKMFMLSPYDELKNVLREMSETQDKEIHDLKSRQTYLQRRLQSQEENMKDIMQSIEAS